MSKQTALSIAQERAEAVAQEVNNRINDLGKNAAALYDILCQLQAQFDKIRGIPSAEMFQYQEIKKVCFQWKQQAEHIETSYNEGLTKSVASGAAGVGLGVAVVALGPTAAMGIATTFGVASTGTAISALSGAAATNAALAWLGGGALAMNGGGMVAGKALLALAGPIGWTIAGIALLGSGLFFWKAKKEKDRLEEIFTLIARRDTKTYELALLELDARVAHIVSEATRLEAAIEQIKSFGTNYEYMSCDQQYALGTYINFMSAASQLLISPIESLRPKYSKEDYQMFVSIKKRQYSFRTAIIYLANLFYQIYLSEEDQKIVCNALKNDEKLLALLDVEKDLFGPHILSAVCEALAFKG